MTQPGIRRKRKSNAGLPLSRRMFNHYAIEAMFTRLPKYRSLRKLGVGWIMIHKTNPASSLND